MPNFSQINTDILILGAGMTGLPAATDLQASGKIAYARTYDPYGVVTSTLDTSQSDYGFTGEYTSGDLVYLRSRFYAPSLDWIGMEVKPRFLRNSKLKPTDVYFVPKNSG